MLLNTFPTGRNNPQQKIPEVFGTTRQNPELDVGQKMKKQEPFWQTFLILSGCHLFAVVLAGAGAFASIMINGSYKCGPQPMGDIFMFALWVLTYPSIYILKSMYAGVLVLVPAHSLVFGLVCASLLQFVKQSKGESSNKEMQLTN